MQMQYLVSMSMSLINEAFAAISTRRSIYVRKKKCVFKKIRWINDTHNFADLHSLVWKYVLLDPRRMVPPICVFEPYIKQFKQIINREIKIQMFLNLFS
jgi:hypothetical protein